MFSDKNYQREWETLLASRGILSFWNQGRDKRSTYELIRQDSIVPVEPKPEEPVTSEETIPPSSEPIACRIA